MTQTTFLPILVFLQLIFADDIVMLSDLHAMQHVTDDLNAANVGLRIGCEKTKTMDVGEPPTQSQLAHSYSRVLKISSTSTSLILKLTYERY